MSNHDPGHEPIRIAVDQHSHLRHLGKFSAGFGDVFYDIDEVQVGDKVLGMFLESEFVADGEVVEINQGSQLIYFTLDYKNTRTM